MGKMEELAAAMMKAIGPNSEADDVPHWLDIGYAPLNKIVSGFYGRGLPSNRIIEVYGPSSSGKTLLATMAMIAAQKAGGIAIFIDWERSFNATFAQLLGLDTTYPRFIYKRAETWESGNTEMMQAVELIREGGFIAPDAPIVAVCDSIAAAVPKSMMYDKDGKKRGINELTMNDTTALARVASTTLKAINQYVGDFNLTAIYLNQIRTKPGVAYGDPTTTPGGVAMEFYASVRIATGQKKLVELEGKEKVFAGRLIGIETKKNKLAMPFQSCELSLRYDENGLALFDYASGLVDACVDEGLIVKDKAYLVWEGKKLFRSVLIDSIKAEKAEPRLTAMLVSKDPVAVAA